MALLQQGVAAAPIIAGGGTIDRIGVVTETAANVYTPGGLNPAPNVFANLPGATITMDVPPGASRLFIAQFSAEAACYGGGGDYCPVRILIGGVEGNPNVGVDFAFDSNDNGSETFSSWESRTMQRSRRITNLGTTPLVVQIVVQRTTTNALTSLRLDDWHLTVLRSV